MRPLRFTLPDFYSLRPLGDRAPFLRHLYITTSILLGFRLIVLLLAYFLMCIISKFYK
jgi:antibiotic biosynthesis monooxygenase (ABM) superfamily enzyme